MAARIIGKNQYGQPIFFGTAADRAAMTAILDPTIWFWQDDGLRFQPDGAGEWIPAVDDGAGGGGTMAGDQFASGTLVDGNAVIIPMAGARLGCVVWTEPAVGDTVTVSYSTDGGTTYKVWPHGAITSASADKSDTILGAITHIKFQRTGGAGITSTYGVTR